MFKFHIFLVLLFVLSCAAPCPKDKKVGTIHYSASTMSFIPSNAQFRSLSFINEKGEDLLFTTTQDKVITTKQIPVKTLCERGGYLDKTVQIEYLEAPTVNLYYVSKPEKYTLAIDITIDGNTPTDGVRDTAFLERVSVWGQKITPDTKTGIMSFITSTRGNENHKDLQSILKEPKQFDVVKDTIILNRKIKNAWFNPSKVDGITIFYSKENGIEAFVTDDNEVWVRK